MAPRIPGGAPGPGGGGWDWRHRRRHHRRFFPNQVIVGQPDWWWWGEPAYYHQFYYWDYECLPMVDVWDGYITVCPWHYDLWPIAVQAHRDGTWEVPRSLHGLGELTDAQKKTAMIQAGAGVAGGVLGAVLVKKHRVIGGVAGAFLGVVGGLVVGNQLSKEPA